MDRFSLRFRGVTTGKTEGAGLVQGGICVPGRQTGMDLGGCKIEGGIVKLNNFNKYGRSNLIVCPRGTKHPVYGSVTVSLL